MNYKTIFILFFCNCLLFTQEIIGEGLYENELIDYLNQNYKTSSVLSYSNARDILYSEIDNNNGNVYGIYTNYSVTLNPQADPSTHLYENGMDCEHLWPQSMYQGTAPMKSDMHHLRPSKSNVNSSRGNKPYNEINDSITNTWFWLTYSMSNIPNSNIHEYSESASYNFEPREDVKGDIARSMFYFYTIYTNVANTDFFNEQKDVLLQWHIQDPANDDEILRTWAIAEYQDNIPNPFILDNTLVNRCYFYEEIESGDLNGDTLINVVDVVILVNYILGIGELNSTNQADMDNNNVINVVDVVLLMNLILR